MSFLEVLRVALLDLALHKFRSLLAALGIIFGVASVEGMISISEGAKQAAMQKYAALGVDNIIIRSIKPTKLDKEPDKSYGYSVAEFGLLRRDLDHVLSTLPHVRHSVGMREMRTNLRSPGGKDLDVSVLATEPKFLDITRTSVDRGRFISDLDGALQKTVCVVGPDAARKLFAFNEPINQHVQIAGDYYRVVGVLANRDSLKSQGGDDINNCVFIPLATARAKCGDVSMSSKTGSFEMVRVQLDGIYLQMDDPLDVLGTADRLKAYLSKTHKNEDYTLLVPLAQMRQKEAEQRIWSIVMGAIAAISLLVGGIGIMNIMLANISDRRKEIGTRRALGARRKDILRQFVLESATLTSLGGLVGTALGYALAWSVTRFAQWPTSVTTYSIVLGIVTSTVVGVAFGFWPAYQAAKVNPIEALRSE